MFVRGRTSALTKPKKLHSLEYLRYLYSVLQKNAIVNDQNSATVVEALRLIAEILIWGDQNDGAVMDFFLEKNVLEHIVKYMNQEPRRAVNVQLLQTLNILFENISNKTAIYYLLSNTHTNEIITHRFDFSDEEVVAYYISFLKALSLRIDPHTINFFYLEPCRQFDLYVECIKLFCHPENMVRIAVRTITLNIHRVKDEGALEFIHHQTALPYFSYLVWSIGNTILDIDDLLLSDLSHQNRVRLEDLVAEHVDHLHYLNDLLSLNIEGINEVLCDQLLHRLLIPLYVYSLTKRYKSSARENARVCRPHVAHPVACFMLIHTFVIIHHADVVRVLAEALFFGDPSLSDLAPISTAHGSDEEQLSKSPSVGEFFNDFSSDDEARTSRKLNPAVETAESLIAASRAIRSAHHAPPGSRLAVYLECMNESDRSLSFRQPSESLDANLKKAKGVTPSLLRSLWPANMSPLKLVERKRNRAKSIPIMIKTASDRRIKSLGDLTETCTPSPYFSRSAPISMDIPPVSSGSRVSSNNENLSFTNKITHVSSTPIFCLTSSVATGERPNPSPKMTHSFSDTSFQLFGRPFLRALYRALEVGLATDYEALFALLLFSVIRINRGIDAPILQLASLSESSSLRNPPYDHLLIGKLLELVADACKAGSRVRLITLYLALRLLTDLVCDSQQRCYLSDVHFAQLISSREEAMMVLRSYFRNDAIFLELFEGELRELQHPFITLHKLAMDFSLLIPPSAPNVPATPAADTHRTRNDYRRRLPRTELEHTQRAIHVYLLVHIALESLLQARPPESETDSIVLVSDEPNTTTGHQESLFSTNLPVDLSVVPGLAGLNGIPDPKAGTLSHKAGDKLDLSSEALIGCTVESGGSHEKRFLVNCGQQLVLVEPDSRQMGWGVITFIGPLQDLEATCDPADSRCLHVSIGNFRHSKSALTYSPVPAGNPKHTVARPSMDSSKCLLTARFLFEDHIRCMTARQMLLRGRELARQTKLRKIAMLLDFSPKFLRETFGGSFLSVNYGSTGDFSHTPDASTGRNAANRPDPTGSHEHAPTCPTANPVRTTCTRNPGTFLMELHQHRTKHHHPDADLTTEGRISLTANNPPTPMFLHKRSDVGGTADVTAVSRTKTRTTRPRSRLSDTVNVAPVMLVQQQLPARQRACGFAIASTSTSTSSTGLEANKRSSVGPTSMTSATGTNTTEITDEQHTTDKDAA